MLHPQAAAALELWSQGPSVADPGFGPADLAEKRASEVALAAAEPKEPVAGVEEVDADGVRCRLYRPGVSPGPAGGDGTTSAGGAIVFLHGGGFVFGDIDTHDAQSRRIANRTGMAVLAVDYRRPPEHRFPAAPDDVDAAAGWLVGHAHGLGLDPDRLVALGDSAGGNLALVAALRHTRRFAATVLVYPFIDPRARFASYQAENGGLTAAEAAWYWRQYVADESRLTDPDVAPIDSPALGELPPTLVIAAEHDVLVDEDEELARRIERAGAAAERSTYPGMIHGFWRHPEMFDAAEESLADIAGFLRRTASP